MLALRQPGALQRRAGLTGDREQERELLLALVFLHGLLEAEHDRAAREADERQGGAGVLAGLLARGSRDGQLGGHLLARRHQHHLAGAGAHHGDRLSIGSWVGSVRPSGPNTACRSRLAPSASRR